LLKFKGTLGTGLMEFFERFLCIGSHYPSNMAHCSIRIPVSQRSWDFQDFTQTMAPS
jgi:hypothetical protein